MTFTFLDHFSIPLLVFITFESLFLEVFWCIVKTKKCKMAIQDGGCSEIMTWFLLHIWRYHPMLHSNTSNETHLNVYRVAWNFHGSLISRIDDFLRFAGANFREFEFQTLPQIFADRKLQFLSDISPTILLILFAVDLIEIQ